MTHIENDDLPALQPGSPAVVSEAKAPERRQARKAAAQPKREGDTRRTRAKMGTLALPSEFENRKQPSAQTKAEAVIKQLRMAKGTTIATLAEATGWQAHSVRGFLSGTVKKKLGLNIISTLGKDRIRRYRIAKSQPLV